MPLTRSRVASISLETSQLFAAASCTATSNPLHSAAAAAAASSASLAAAAFFLSTAAAFFLSTSLFHLFY
jgi:hypothetical protein